MPQYSIAKNLEINDKIEKSQQRKRTYKKGTKWKLQKLNLA